MTFGDTHIQRIREKLFIENPQYDGNDITNIRKELKAIVRLARDPNGLHMQEMQKDKGRNSLYKLEK